MRKIYFFFLIFCTCIFGFASGANVISIGGVSYSVDTLSHMKVGPGTYYSALKYSTSTKALRVFMLEVDAKNPYISFQSVLGKDSTITTERVSSMAIRKSKTGAVYFAGTNADFFDTSTSHLGYPCGGCVVEGQIATAPTTNPAMSFAGNVPILDNVSFTGSTCKIGTQTLAINGVNTTRLENYLVLYNTLNGNYTHTNGYGTEVLVELPENAKWGVNTSVKAKVIKIESRVGNMHILPNHAVLSGHGTAETFLAQLKENDEVEIYLGLTPTTVGGSPAINAMVGGDRIILKSGAVTNNDWVDPNPRTSLGYSQDKSKIYLCVLDGRSTISVGSSTKQLADIMKSAGAYDAINLDGGGSSAMYIKQFGIMNVPSDGQERAVANGIYAVNIAPDDNNIAEIRCSQGSVALPRYGVYAPVFYGYNQYGTLINTNVAGVKLSCSSDLGEVNSSGAFVASGTQSGTLYADYNGIKTSIPVDLYADAVPYMRLDSVIADKKHEYPIEVEAMVGLTKMSILPQAISWTVDNPEICSVDNGVLKGLSNGTTYIRGKLGNIDLAQKVTVEIPASDVVSADKISDLSTWSVKSSSNITGISLTSATFPAAIRYTYSSGRSPYVQLYKEFPLYGIPDSMQILFNTGDAVVLKAIVTARANNQTIYSPVEFTGIEKGKDYLLNFPMGKLLSDINDRANYPVHFEGLKLMLDATTQTSGQTYDINIKEFSITYGNINVGITNPELMTKLSVYPNPVKNGTSYVTLTIDEPQSVRMELYSLSGKKVLSKDFGECQPGEVKLPVNGIKPGSYLLNIYNGDKRDVAKLIFK